MQAKRILVIGGAGFIGSEVNKLLNKEGYETIVFDNLSYGNRHQVKWGTFIKGDIGNRRSLEKLFSQYQFDAVMHFAALIDVGESIINPGKYYENNVSFTLNLLEVMRKFGVKFFIFSSSAAIYGMPQQELINEDHPKIPINPYGYSKLIIENILEDFDRAYGLKSAKLRYFNAAGGDPDGEIKNYNLKKTNLIPILLNAIANNQPITINGTDYPTPDGTCIRDYIHIYDLGIAHINAMKKLFNDNKSEAYNLGNGKGFSIREVINTSEQITQKSVQIIEGPRRAGDPPFLLANSQKAKQLLNWHPKYPNLDLIIQHAFRATHPRATRPGPRQKADGPLHTP